VSQKVTFKQLQKTLNGLGFEARQSLSSSHVIFKHSKTGVVLTVPNSGPTVPPVYVNTAARQVANSGIATVTSFENKLERAGKDLT
jgi:predicted RNA binding protein YcfA (HicA-like mRNA interferase family)